MPGSTDALTRFLTGELAGYLLLSALLTWPVSLILLSLYRRAVRRSMSARPGSQAQPREGWPESEPAAVAPFSAIDETGDAPVLPEAAALFRQLTTRPWRAGARYAAAGIVYGAVLSAVTGWFAEPGVFRPVRFLMLTVLFAWPVVLTLSMAAAAVRPRKLAVGGVYLFVYVVLIYIGVRASSEFSMGQGLLLWGLYNGPGTALVALCLSRRIRAVGPLVLLFLILGFLGANSLLTLLGSNTSLLYGAVTIGDWFGLDYLGTFLAIVLTGFAGFGVVAAILLAVIRRRYEAKRLSDESLTIDTVWWLFVFSHAVGLVFEHPVAPLGGVAAMVAFKGVTRIGFARLTPPAAPGSRLLLLRSFSIGPAAERLFDALEKHWRRIGSIQMIAGEDLATRTVEPHEFLDFVTGRLSRRFIDGEAALGRRLNEMDLLPDRDGRFRVNDFFCHDNAWRTVLSRLVDQSDVVLMDLRGFSKRNAGCIFEIGELFRLVPLERVLFVVDGSTDRGFLDRTFGLAAAMAVSAPAIHSGRVPQPRLFTCGRRLDVPTLNRLLRALAAAAAPAPAAGTG